MENREKEILELREHYSVHPKQQVSNSKKTKDDWYGRIHMHFKQELEPYLKEKQTQFIEYWPAGFFWDERISNQTYSDHIQRVVDGFFGTGYLAVSGEAIYICVFKELSKLYSMLDTGLFYRVLTGAGGERDDRERYGEDKTWRVSFSEIRGTRTLDDATLLLSTSTGDWKVQEHFQGSLDLIKTAIDLGREGRFSDKKSTDGDEIIAMIEKLAKLQDSGAITNEEFEAKKRELLSRIK